MFILDAISNYTLEELIEVITCFQGGGGGGQVFILDAISNYTPKELIEVITCFQVGSGVYSRCYF